MSKKSKIFGEADIHQKIKRLAWQIYENNLVEKEIFIVGISDRGFILANKLNIIINQISDISIKLGRLDLDKEEPYNKKVSLNISEEEFAESVIILVDDVLNSGKTLMFATKHFLNKPLSKLSVLVLVERNHNNYPIKADYVGISLATTFQEYVKVDLSGSNKGIYLC